MAVVSAQISTYDVTGKPRDLSDVIFDISPTDTPFLTMCKKAKATQTLHEWTTDSLAAPAANAKVEGADKTTYAGSKAVEVSNKTQIMDKVVKVTGTAQAITEAGLSDQYDYQLAQRMKELKKDVEFNLLMNQIEVTGDATSTARLLRGLPCWLTSNTSLGTNGAVATSSAAVTDGTNRTFTEAMLTAVIQAAYTLGGNPSVLMAAPAVRATLSSVLTGGATKFIEVKDKKAVATVDYYLSDFGEFKIVPNRVQAGVTYSADAVFVLDPEYWAVAYLRPFRDEGLAKIGDSVRGLVSVELTLEARNQAASGMVGDLS